MIFVNLSDVRNIQTSVLLLKLWYRRLAKVSFSYKALEASKYFISFKKVKTDQFLVYDQNVGIVLIL